MKTKNVDDILEIPEWLRKLNPGPKWQFYPGEKVVTKRKRDNGEIIITERWIKRPYWLVNGVPEHEYYKKEKKSFVVSESKPKKSNGKQRERWLTDIIRKTGPIGTKTLYKYLHEHKLEPHEGFLSHSNYQAHMRSILIRLKRKGILGKKKSKYIIR